MDWVKRRRLAIGAFAFFIIITLPQGIVAWLFIVEWVSNKDMPPISLDFIDLSSWVIGIAVFGLVLWQIRIERKQMMGKLQSATQAQNELKTQLDELQPLKQLLQEQKEREKSEWIKPILGEVQFQQSHSPATPEV